MTSEVLSMKLIDSNSLPMLPGNHSIKIPALVRSSNIPNSEKIFIISHHLNVPVKFHRHDFYEFVFITNGIAISNINGKDIYLLPDSLLLMNLHSSHSLKVKDPKSIVINICIKPEILASGVFADFLKQNNYLCNFLNNQGNKDYLYFSPTHLSRYLPIINGILSEYAKNNYHYNYAMLGLLLIFFDQLSHENYYSYVGIDDLCLKIITKIKENIRTITVQELAQNFNYCTAYLSRYVKKHTSMTIKEIIIQEKMKQAKKYLTETNYSIEEIATLAGYKSVSYFFKTFERQNNITPDQFRKTIYQKPANYF